MFCQNCGKEIIQGAKFCSSCGTPAFVPPAPNPTPAPPVYNTPYNNPTGFAPANNFGNAPAQPSFVAPQATPAEQPLVTPQAASAPVEQPIVTPQAATSPEEQPLVAPLPVDEPAGTTTDSTANASEDNPAAVSDAEPVYDFGFTLPTEGGEETDNGTIADNNTSGFTSVPEAEPTYGADTVPPAAPAMTERTADTNPAQAPTDKPLSTILCLGLTVLFMIPVIGLIASMALSFGATDNQNRKALARTWLILKLVALVLLVFTVVVAVACASELLEELNELFGTNYTDWSAFFNQID